MDDHAQQFHNDSFESHINNMSKSSAAENLLALRPTTNRAPMTSRHPAPIQDTAPPPETSAFLASLSAHCAARSDVVTPHIFTQLCKDYHTRKITENDFYVSVYRLFCATDAQHLMEGFRAFLPSAWKKIELGWLDRAVEEDVKRQAQDSRELTASLIAMLEGHGAGVSSVQDDDADAMLVDDDHDDDDSLDRLSEDGTEVLVKTPPSKKRKTPKNVFRSATKVGSRPAESSTTSPMVPMLLAESSTTSPDPTSPTPEDHSEAASAPKKKPATKKGKKAKKAKTLVNTRRSSPRVPSPLVESSTTPPESTPAPTKKAIKSLATHEEKDQAPAPAEPVPENATTKPKSSASLDRASAPKTSPSPLPRSSSPSATPIPFTPNTNSKPTRNYHRSTSPLHPASTITHLGPVYRDKRAILSRPATKPYIHGLCGMRFGHPAEVQRHHVGQGGRPGCWEKKGKPGSEEGGDWDSHESCKVTLNDLVYRKVREGFVVTSWGDVRGVEGLREGEDEGEDEKGIGGEVGGGTEAGESVTADGADAAGIADAGVAVPETDGIDVEDGKKKRKKTVLRFKVKLPVKTKATDATAGGEGIEEDEDLKAFVDAQSSPEPAKKRQKTLDNTTTDAGNTINAAAPPSSKPLAEKKRQKSLDTTATTGDDDTVANAAAARAVVFGLRARK
jgi:hypothetical protein